MKKLITLNFLIATIFTIGLYAQAYTIRKGYQLNEKAFTYTYLYGECKLTKELSPTAIGTKIWADNTIYDFNNGMIMVLLSNDSYISYFEDKNSCNLYDYVNKNKAKFK